jgi:predicted RNase H-like HicB family nuclease
MPKRTFTVIIWKEREVFVGEVVKLPQVKAVGRTPEDVRDQLKEELERRFKDGTDLPDIEQP